AEWRHGRCRCWTSMRRGPAGTGSDAGRNPGKAQDGTDDYGAGRILRADRRDFLKTESALQNLIDEIQFCSTFLVRLTLFRPMTAEDAIEPGVPLVTPVFVDLVVGVFQRNHGGPGSRPGRRIVDRELVLDRRRTQPRETFDQVQ